jgi:hypothetical protein
MRLTALLPCLLLAGCARLGLGGGNSGTTVTSAPGSPAAPSAATAAAVAAAAPVSFMRSTSEALVTRMIDVRDGLTKAQAMRTLMDALGQKYTVEVSDPRAGFAMTSWQASLLHDGVPDLRYRTRITTRFVGDDWKKLQVRDEANWARGEEWDVGYDVAQLDSVTNDLKAKLGPKRP